MQFTTKPSSHPLFFFLSVLLLLSSFGLCDFVKVTENVIAKPFGLLRDETMSRAILEFLEALRCRMDMDMPEIGIPVLEPLEMEELEFDLDEDLGKISGLLENLKVEGLSSFNVTDIDFEFITLFFFMDITFPELKMSGHYDIDGVLGGMLPLYGAGNFELSLVGLRIYMAGEIGYDGYTEIWSMPDLNLIVSVQSMSTNFEGLMNDTVVEDFFNLAMSEIGPQVLNEMFPELEPDIVQMAQEMTPDLLAGYTIYDVVDILFQTIPFFPEVEEGKCDSN